MEETALGWSVGGFYRMSSNMELGAGFQQWDQNTDTDGDAFGNILLGATYSPDPDHWKDTLFKLKVNLLCPSELVEGSVVQ